MTPELIRPATAAARFDISRSTIARRMRDDPAFPQPIRVNARLLLFKLSELDSYFDAKRSNNPKEAANA